MTVVFEKLSLCVCFFLNKRKSAIEYRKNNCTRSASLHSMYFNNDYIIKCRHVPHESDCYQEIETEPLYVDMNDYDTKGKTSTQGGSMFNI